MLPMATANIFSQWTFWWIQPVRLLIALPKFAKNSAKYTAADSVSLFPFLPSAAPRRRRPAHLGPEGSVEAPPDDGVGLLGRQVDGEL